MYGNEIGYRTRMGNGTEKETWHTERKKVQGEHDNKDWVKWVGGVGPPVVRSHAEYSPQGMDRFVKSQHRVADLLITDKRTSCPAIAARRTAQAGHGGISREGSKFLP